MSYSPGFIIVSLLGVVGLTTFSLFPFCTEWADCACVLSFLFLSPSIYQRFLFPFR